MNIIRIKEIMEITEGSSIIRVGRKKVFRKNGLMIVRFIIVGIIKLQGIYEDL